MNLHVYFTPAELLSVNSSPDDIYIVVDVIRATTTITVMFERGAARVLTADTLEQARRAAERFPARLLCGERNALPLPDFDYGNSPAQFSRLDLSGRELILTTTNGSRAFFACPSQSIRLAGCFYNARAATAYALTRAQQRNNNIALVCAGEAGYFALDDAVCAGYLALELQRQQPDLQVHESVYAATALYNAYTPPRLLDYGHSARSVIEAGVREDLDLCMRVDASASVPLVRGQEEETDLLILERA